MRYLLIVATMLLAANTLAGDGGPVPPALPELPEAPLAPAEPQQPEAPLPAEPPEAPAAPQAPEAPEVPLTPLQPATPALPLPAAAKLPDRAELEKQFSESMNGVVLVGNFTLGKVSPDKPLSEERYTINRVTKLKGDYWLFETRIQYGGHDVNLPLPLRVLWAGDTPVITLDEVPIPGMGTFTARVLIYRDQYAGTWSGKDHGGHLFGRIEKATPAGE